MFLFGIWLTEHNILIFHKCLFAYIYVEHQLPFHIKKVQNMFFFINCRGYVGYNIGPNILQLDSVVTLKPFPSDGSTVASQAK